MAIDAHGNEGFRDQSKSEKERPQLRRSLTTPQIIFMVVAASAPLTASIGAMPLSIVASGNAAAPVYFVAATVLLLLFSVGFVSMSRYLPGAGAFYTYITAGLGRILGGAAAMLATGAYGLTVIALAVFAGPFMQSLVGTFTSWANSPWWLWSLLFSILLAVLGYRNIDLSAKVLGVLLALEVSVIIVLGIAVLAQGGMDGITMQPLNPVESFNHGDPALGIMFAVLVFVGFEATAVYRGEAKNPGVTIPRATYGAVLILGILYVFTTFYIVIGYGTERVVETLSSDPSAVLFGLSTTYMSPGYTDILNVMILGSIFACALSIQNVVNRYQLALGRSGFLPTYVGEVHPKHYVPSNASVVLSTVVFVGVAISALLELDPITEVAFPILGLLGYAVVSMMMLCSVAVIVFFYRHAGDKPNVWVRVVAPLAATLGLLFVLTLAFINIEAVGGSQIATNMITGLMIALPLLGAILAVIRRDREIDDVDFSRDESGPSPSKPE